MSGLSVHGTSFMGKGIEPSKSITIFQSLAKSSRQGLLTLGLRVLFFLFDERGHNVGDGNRLSRFPIGLGYTAFEVP